MMTDDPGQFPFGMLAQREELPGMEVGVEVTVVTDGAMEQRLVEPQREVVKGEPEQGDAQPRRDGRGNLQDAFLHEAGARRGEVHVTTGDEGGVERGVIDVAFALEDLQIDGEHAGLAIALHPDAELGFELLFGKDDVLGLGLEVVAAVRGHLVPFVEDAPDDFGCTGGEVGGAEEGGVRAALLQAVEDAGGAVARYLHRFVHRDIDAVFAGHIVLLGVET